MANDGYPSNPPMDSVGIDAGTLLGTTPGTTGLAVLATTTQDAAQGAIGATTTGKALIVATDAAAAQTAIGATTTGKALIVATDAAAAQTAIGATTTGKALITAADAAGARTTLGLATIAASGAGGDLTANSVTNAKLAQIATAIIKGRVTGGTGNVEDLTPAQVAALMAALDITHTGIHTFNGGIRGFDFTRDKIINGNFNLWDYATTQTANGYGSANRWRTDANGSTFSVSRQSFTLGQTDVPGEPQFFLRCAVTSVAGAGNNCVFRQRIEGVRTFAGKTITLSFYAKADALKNLAVEFVQNFGTGGSPSADVNSISPAQYVLSGSFFQKHTMQVTLPAISGKTIGTDGNDYLEVNFWFDAGSTYNGRTASLGQQSGTFDIAKVRLCAGATDCDGDEDRPLVIEKVLCARYLPVVEANSNYATLGAMGVAGSTVEAYINIPFRVPVRTKTTGLSISNATDLRLSDMLSGTQATAVAHYDADINAAIVKVTVSSGLTQLRTYFLQSTGVTTAKLLFTGAEL